MSPLGEQTLEASLARINAALQGTGSPEIFAQYPQGVYLNQPFGRPEHAHEVARALGEGPGHARVERDKDPDQNDRFWVRLLTPHEITDAMVADAASILDRVRQREHAGHQQARPTGPRPGDGPAPTPTKRVRSTAAFPAVGLEEKDARMPGYVYAGGQQLNTIFEVGDGGGVGAVAVTGIRNQRDAMLELHSDGPVAIHVDAADAMGGIRDPTRYLATRDDRDLAQPGGPLVVEFTADELDEVAAISTADAGPFGRRTIIAYKDHRALNVLAGDVRIALKTGGDAITEPLSASEEALSALRAKRAE